MQHFKQINWKKFLLQGVLPCLLAVAVGFISRYQLELSDGVTPSFLELQWPLYAPLNALTAFCLTLILFAVLGKWSRATGISGAVFTVIALINYYTRDLHGSALMPQDILNLGTAAEVMSSYTLKITLEPNTSGASRTATIVITCGTSKIEITVTQEGGKLVIALHIKVGFGLNISTITQSITHRVKDEVELATGLKVARIDVYVDDVIAD